VGGKTKGFIKTKSLGRVGGGIGGGMGGGMGGEVRARGEYRFMKLNK